MWGGNGRILMLLALSKSKVIMVKFPSCKYITLILERILSAIINEIKQKLVYSSSSGRSSKNKTSYLGIIILSLIINICIIF